MTNLAKFAVLAVAIAFAAGCGGGGTYQFTDVAAPPDFTETAVSGVQHGPNNMLLSGTLEYDGGGDLKAAFHQYLDLMVKNGWTPVTQESSGEKATATMRKDNRTCNVEFTGTAGQIKAVIKVVSVK